MKILITGGSGQLGRALRKILPPKNSTFLTRENLDITDEKTVVQQIADDRPEIVIHTAAYTDVDGCEKNPDLAFRVNVRGTENVVQACQKIGAALIYISTDYVFNGKKRLPYKEEDKPNPLSIYGKTKWRGEEIVKRLDSYFVIRTAWLYGEGKNFVQTILQLAKEKKEIRVVNDQIGSPTHALDLAKAIWKLIVNCKFHFANYRKIENCTGIYHITNSGQCSWYEFAQEIIRSRSLKVKILPITTEDWQKIKPNSAPRPRYSTLSNKKIEALGIKMRPWQSALNDYLKTISNTL